MTFTEGIFAGAGALALAQNLGDYRIDQVFMEYVFDPVKVFFLKIFGKKGMLTRLELKAKADLHDAFAKLTNLQKTVVTDASKVGGELDKLVEEVKAKL